MKIKDNKGFTLIELLLVILIIIGLAAIVVPNYMSVSDESDTAVNAANEEAVKAAVRLLVLDVGLSSLPGSITMSSDLNTSGTSVNLASYGTTWPHGPYIDVDDFPVTNASGTAYAVSVDKTTGSINITP